MVFGKKEEICRGLFLFSAKKEVWSVDLILSFFFAGGFKTDVYFSIEVNHMAYIYKSPYLHTHLILSIHFIHSHSAPAQHHSCPPLASPPKSELPTASY
jgi:hypothetical protein